MVRNYVRKSERKLISPKCLQKAKHMVAKGISIRNVATKLGVKLTTIRRRLKAGSVAKSLGRYEKTFSKEQETELVNFLKGMDERFFGVPKRMLGGLVYQFADQNGLPHSFNSKTKQAGRDWIESFLKRNHLSLRSPQKTSVARTMGFNKPQVDRFLDQFAKLMVTSGVLNSARQIYNMDESGFSTVPDDTEKVISEKNKKHVGRISSAERGVLVTVIAAINAAGSVVPPGFVFPRIRKNPNFLKGMKEDFPTVKLYCTESGYSNSDIFLEWMHHFISEVRPNKDFPVVLLLDNHASHLNYDAICLAKKNFVHMLTIPPHSSHEVQPLDVGFFSPLKTYWAQNVNDYLMLHPGEVVSIHDFCQLFKTAYQKVLHPSYAVNAFAKTGLCPFDRNKFTETMYLPSAVTDQKLDDVASEDENNDCMEGVEQLPGSEIDVISISQVPENIVDPSQRLSDLIEEAEIFQYEHDHQDVFDFDIPVVNEEDLDDELRDKLVAFDEMTDPVKMQEIFPFPKIAKHKKRSSRAVCSSIITASPELEKIKLKKEETEAKKELARERKEKNDKKKLEAAKKIILAEMKKKSENKPTKKSRPKKKMKPKNPTNAEKENPVAEEENLVVNEENSDAEKEKPVTEQEKRVVEKEQKRSKIKMKAQRQLFVEKGNQKDAENPVVEKENLAVEKENPAIRKKQKRLKNKNEKQRQLPDEKSNQNDDDTICPGCQGAYEDPPTEDWIQCCICGSWWHEYCTNYERIGDYICDLCTLDI